METGRGRHGPPRGKGHLLLPFPGLAGRRSRTSTSRRCRTIAFSASIDNPRSPRMNRLIVAGSTLVALQMSELDSPEERIASLSWSVSKGDFVVIDIIVQAD